MPSLLDDYLRERGLGTEREGIEADVPILGDRITGPTPGSALAAPTTNPYLTRPIGGGFTSAGNSPTSSLSRMYGVSDAPESHPIRDAWRTITKPLRVFNSVTGNVGGQVAGFLDPAGYAAAKEERRAGILEGQDPNRDLTLAEDAETLPGLGDVLASHIDKEGWVGRLRPVASLVGNIAGDPTTYIGGLGLLTKGGKAASALAGAQRGLEAAEAAGDVAKVAELTAAIPTLAGNLSRIYAGEGAVSRGVRTGLEAVDALNTGIGPAAAKLISQPSFRAATQFGLRAPISPLAGLAYAPEIAEGAVSGVQQVAADVQGGRYKEAVAGGVGTLIQSALGLLVAKGLVHETTAARTLHEALRANQVDKSAAMEGAMNPAAETAPTAPQEAALPSLQADQQPVAAEPGVGVPELPAPTPLQEAPAPAVSVAPEVPPAVEVAPGVPPAAVQGEGAGVTEQPAVAVVAQPTQSTQPATPAAAPVAPSTLDPANQQKLNDFLDAAVESGTPVTIKALADAGILTPQQAHRARKSSLAKVIGSEGMARLEPSAKRGGAYTAKAREAAIAPQVDNPVVNAATPAEPAAPATVAAPVPRTEIDRQLENPELRQNVNQTLQDIADGAGKPLDEVTADDLRVAFPGDEHKQTRSLLNRALHAGKKVRKMTALEQAAQELKVAGEARAAGEEGGGGTSPVPPPALSPQGEAPPSPSSSPKPITPAPAPTLEAVRAAGLAPAERSAITPPTAANALTREKSMADAVAEGRDIATDQTGRDRVPAPGATSYEAPATPPSRPVSRRLELAGLEPEERARFQAEMDRRASRSTETFAPGSSPEAANANAYLDFIEQRGTDEKQFAAAAEREIGKSFENATTSEMSHVLALAKSHPERFGVPEPAFHLDTPQLRAAAERLTGMDLAGLSEKEQARFTKDKKRKQSKYGAGSPAQKVLNNGIPEDFVQSRLDRWLRIVANDPDPAIQKIRAKSPAFVAKLENLLLVEPDQAKARTELSKLLYTATKNLEKNERGQIVKQRKIVERNAGELSSEGTLSFDHGEVAAEGLDPVESKRLSVTKSKAGTARPDLPRRPDSMSEADWAAAVKGGDAATRKSVLESLAWAVGEKKRGGAVRTGTAGQRAPHMAILADAAKDLGLHVGANDGADKILKKLRRVIGAEPPAPNAHVTDLLTDQLVAERGAAWTKKIAASPRIGDTDARVVDFEGDAPALVAPLVKHGGPLAETLSKLTADLAAATELPSRFAGLTPSPQLNGVRIGDAIYLNPVEAWANAKSAHERSSLTGDALASSMRDTAASHLVDVSLHEMAHFKARHDAATGDVGFIEAYRQAIEDAAPHYNDAVARVGESLSPLIPHLESTLHPAYTAAKEAIRARIERAATNDARPGQRRIAPIPDRPRGGQGGTARGVADGARPDLALSGGGRQAAEGLGDRTAAQEGAAGDSARSLAGERAQGPGGQSGPDVGRRAAGGERDSGAGGEELAGSTAAEVVPQASLTKLVPQSIRAADTKRTLDKIQQAFAASVARYSGNDTKEAAQQVLRDIEAAQKLSPAERRKLLAAGPKAEYDIGLNIKKYAEAMDDDQRVAVAMALSLRNADQPRAKPVTFDAIDREGRELLDVHNPEQLAKFMERTGMKSPRDFAALRTIVATFGEKVDRAREDLRLIGDETPANKAQRDAVIDTLGHAELVKRGAIETLIPNKTNVGRMLSFFRSMAHPLTAEENFRARFYGAMEASRIPKPKAQELYSMLSDTLKDGPAGDWSQFTNAFRDATRAKGFEKFLEFWKAGLLGWPTQIANVTSNGMFFGLRNVEHGVTALADATLSGITGKPRSRYVGETVARTLALRHGLGEAWSMFKDDVREMALLHPPDIGKRLERGTFQEEPNFRQLYGAIDGKTGEFVRIPFKLLDAADNFFKHMIRTQEYAAQAHRLAQDPKVRASMGMSGPSTSAATAQIFGEFRRLAQDPITNSHLMKKPGYKEALSAAHAASIADTFQAPSGKLIRAVNQFAQVHPAIELLLPFRKTPYNILAEGMKRTPLGALHALNEYRSGRTTNPEFVHSMVKSAIGTAIMGAVSSYALSGDITGGGPADPKQQELKKKTGWLPYSFKIPGENGAPAQYISYARMEPIATLLGVSADLTEAWQRKDIDNADELMQKVLESVSNNITNKSFLTGVDSLMKIITGAGGGRAQAIRQLQASLVPNVIGVVPVAHAARAVDPVYRETKAGTLSPFIAQIPGLSTSLEPQYSPTGEIRERSMTAGERLLSPFQRSVERQDPISDAASELVRLGVSINKPPLYEKIGEDKIYYTPDEREQIGRIQEHALEKIGRAMASSSYASLPDDDSIEGGTKRRTKRDVIQQIFSKTTNGIRQRVNRQALQRARYGEV